MMKRRKIAVIVGLFLLLLTGVRLAWIDVQTTSTRAEAEKGHLDLRQWIPSDKPILSLVGEWEFYPSQLLTPGLYGAFGQEGDTAKTVTVPGSWQRDLSPQRYPAFGYGTYRLRVLMPAEGLPSLTVRVPGLSASSALYVNGRLLGNSGHPSDRASTYTAGNVPYSVTFEADRGVLDLVLQVANYDDRVMGGLTEPVQLGTAQAMSRAYWFSAGSQAAMFLLMIMHALYAFVLYFIGARQKPLLIFSLLALSGAAAVTVDQDRLLSAWFGVGYETVYKIYYLSYLGSAALLLQYVKSLLPGFPVLRHSRWHLAACGVFGACVLAMPVSMFTYVDGLHTALMLVAFAATPVFLYMAVRRGVPDAIYLLLGAVAVAMNLVWGVLNYTLLLDIGYYPFDMLALFTAFALYWFKRYFRNAAETARLAKRLQEADKLKDEFLVHTSHELRNPLHGILNMAQTVLDSGGQSDEEANRSRLNLLVSVGKRMSLLLNDLIDLTRLRENRLRLKKSPLRLQAEAAGVLDMIRFMTEGKPIQLENRIPDSLPPVLADENRLVQIMFNLLHNAVKFTNEGLVAIEAKAEGERVVVRITDTGIGMDEAVASRIFQPYEQGAEQAETNAAGFGLGLAITKQLVELHHGELTFSSTPNVGSVFQFTLPVAKPADVEPAVNTAAVLKPIEEEETLIRAETVAAALPEAPALADRPRILAVDDDPVNLRVLTNALAPDQYEIVTATSGSEALSLLNSGTWQLLVADVMMPEMSGYEVTRTVRSLFSHSELPILLLTARYRAEDIEAGFRAGANDYIVKPVDAHELRARVKALTDVTRAAREQSRLEAAWLQAQIQPHFLFNTLNSVAALVEVDPDRMRNLLLAFGDYLRASFDFANLERLVPLRKELELVRAYLYIEKERFGNRLQVEWDTVTRGEWQVPPLSVQPLVENAVRHGLLGRIRGGTARIRVRDLGNGAEISVEDDGIGMEPETWRRALNPEDPLGRKMGVGLANTDRRLKQLFGKGLQFQSAPGQGTIVSFVVPKDFGKRTSVPSDRFENQK
ncbi:ATP-binding protein [uncultured Paenibacillus sp.]|uniref:hybrid sensor histidine kinase/response regulator n=1 Tax=uncultured Paenibacillus sp. TaxID=227322 RepID=UPI002804F85C|nr:ATP-binding protein [uncultured Paenibacillus sp.]